MAKKNNGNAPVTMEVAVPPNEVTMAEQENGNATVMMGVAVPPNEVRYRGVRKKQRGRYGAEIRYRSKGAPIWLGMFDTPVEAAKAYDVAARFYRGPRAITNFPETAEHNPNNYKDLLEKLSTIKNNIDGSAEHDIGSSSRPSSNVVRSPLSPQFHRFPAFHTDGTAPPPPMKRDKYYLEVLTRAGVIRDPANFQKETLDYSIGSESGVQNRSPTTSAEPLYPELNLELSLAPPGRRM